MGSGAWKGAGLGAILFLVIVAVGALTPLRVPLLKIAGRDYPALQLQKEAAQAAVSSRAPASGPDALTRERVDVRLEAWHKRNATLSVFGLLGWLMEMWPWLLGLGVALPLLGGLIGAQDERRNPGHEGRGRRDTPSGSPRAAGPVVDSPVARPPAAVPTEPEPPAASVVEPPPAATPVVPAAPAPPSAPLPPSEWSWNARPVPRRAPGRPKPPPVESPNSDAV